MQVRRPASCCVTDPDAESAANLNQHFHINADADGRGHSRTHRHSNQHADPDCHGHANPAGTQTPTCVVGSGTGASCTEAALNACLPGGGSFNGTVTFNCGGAATVTVTSTKTISADTAIDGGSLITISAGAAWASSP